MHCSFGNAYFEVRKNNRRSGAPIRWSSGSSSSARDGSQTKKKVTAVSTFISALILL